MEQAQIRIVREAIVRAQLSAVAERQFVDSMINVRPAHGNRWRGVDDPAVQDTDPST